MSEQKGKQKNDNRSPRITLTPSTFKALSWLTRELGFSGEWKTVEWLIQEHETIITGILQGKIGLDNLPPPMKRTREKDANTSQKSKSRQHLTEDGKLKRMTITRSSDRCLSALCNIAEMKHKGYAVDWLLKIWQMNNPGLLPFQIQNETPRTTVEQPWSITSVTVPQVSEAVGAKASCAFDRGASARALDWLGILGELGGFTDPLGMPQHRTEGNLPSDQNDGDVFKQNYGSVIPIGPNYEAVFPLQQNHRAEFPVQDNYEAFLECNNLQEENIGKTSKTSELRLNENGLIQINAGIPVEQNYGDFLKQNDGSIPPIRPNYGAFSPVQQNCRAEFPVEHNYEASLQCNNLQKVNIGGASETSEFRTEENGSIQINGGVPVEQGYGDVFEHNYGSVIPIRPNYGAEFPVQQNYRAEFPIEQNYGGLLQCKDLQEGNIGETSETSEFRMQENGTVQLKGGVTVEQKYGAFLQLKNLEGAYTVGASEISELQMEANDLVQIKGVATVEQNYGGFPECSNLQMENINNAPKIQSPQNYGTFLHCNEFQKENIRSAPEIPQSAVYEAFLQCGNVQMSNEVTLFEQTYGAGAFLMEANDSVQMDGGRVPDEQNYETFFQFDGLEEENIDVLLNMECK